MFCISCLRNFTVCLNLSACLRITHAALHNPKVSSYQSAEVRRSKKSFFAQTSIREERKDSCVSSSSSTQKSSNATHSDSYQPIDNCQTKVRIVLKFLGLIKHSGSEKIKSKKIQAIQNRKLHKLSLTVEDDSTSGNKH